MKTNIQQFKTTGQYTLTYPPALRSAVEGEITRWKAFCAQPLDEKRKVGYSNNAAGVGYEYKDGSGPKGDRKENMDLNNGPLIDLIRASALGFARECESEYGLDGFVEEVRDSTFFVRLIHYFGDRSVGEETATSHVDQSGFTFHLYESDPGLQGLLFDSKQWVHVPVSAGETVIFPAMQLQLRSHGDIRALCHRVVANPHTAEFGRYSAVCFVQLKDTAKYDKGRCGRLQEKAPGFNYPMSHEEFATLFR